MKKKRWQLALLLFAPLPAFFDVFVNENIQALILYFAFIVYIIEGSLFLIRWCSRKLKKTPR